jgi:hypothetical protein
MRIKKMRGGNTNLASIPVESYGFNYGSTPGEDALGRMNASQSEQNNLNNKLAGGKRIKRGGGQGDIAIPQFSEYGSGSQSSPQNGNTASLQVNQALITAMNDAENDTLIGTTQTQTGGKTRRRRKKSRKTRKHKKRSMKKRRTKRRY